MTIKWKQVNMYLNKEYREEDFDDFYMKVYHEDTYLGRLESNDSDLDKFVEPGEGIEIAGFNYSAALKRVPIGLETSHPSKIEQEVSLFPVTPRYKIYFEELRLENNRLKDICIHRVRSLGGIKS